MTRVHVVKVNTAKLSNCPGATKVECRLMATIDILLFFPCFYCTVLYCTVQYRTVLYSTELYCNELNGITEYYVLYDEMNMNVSAFHSLHFNVHT